MEKITVHKNDEATLVAEKIIDSQAKEITLAIPRFSKFVESAVNFRLIKREAEELGKKIIIESVDDDVNEHARVAGIECINPFFSHVGKQLADIAPPKQHQTKEEHQRVIQKHIEDSPEEHIPLQHKRRIRLRLPRQVSGMRVTALGIIFIVIVVGGVFLGVKVLPRATITINATTLDRSYADSITVDTALTSINLLELSIPGESFTQKKNLQLSFPTSGKKYIEQKAEGVITVYNAHSSEPQGLVKNTRFETPDGKVYRLVSALTVPGAEIIDGKVVPSSIDAKVIADKAGADYNSGPVQKFTIPGFSGSPKFKTFYGASTGSMSKGFVGETAYPHDADLAEAKKTLTETLERSMEDLMRAQIPREFKIIDGATKFTLSNIDINTALNESGQFAVFGEGEMTMTAFREDDLLSLFHERAEKEAEVDFDVREYSLTYGAGALASAGNLIVPVEYTGTLTRSVDPVAIKNLIAGKAESELRSLIFSLPGIQSAHISLWPFWVRDVSDNIENIDVRFQ